MNEIFRADLQANSKRRATYSLLVKAVTAGFVVETQRGSGGKKTGGEKYWRETPAEAMRLANKIKTAKSRPNRKRVYSPTEQASTEEQFSLF